jgi:hypothetical protein
VIRCALFLAAPSIVAAPSASRLSPQTEMYFADYQKSAESKIDWTARFPTLATTGATMVTPAATEGSINIKNGMIHDWIAATFASGATPQNVIALLQDYANYKTIYSPDVSDSRVLAQDGNRWRIYLRLMKRKILTAELNSEYQVEYRPLTGGRWAVISHSTKIAELDHGRELPPGTGQGFLWHLNAYWLIEPRHDGIYLECRTISLSRDIPMSLGWMLSPIVSSLPRESLRSTLEATVRALRN